MVSKDNIQPLIGRRFILPFIALFFVNILLICYEINTGFEDISDKKNIYWMKFVFLIIFVITQTVNAMIISWFGLLIGVFIGSVFDFMDKFFGFLFVVSLWMITFAGCFITSFYALLGEMSADSRLQIQCTILLTRDGQTFRL